MDNNGSSVSCASNGTNERLDRDGGLPGALMINVPLWIVSFLFFSWMLRRHHYHRDRPRIVDDRPASDTGIEGRVQDEESRQSWLLIARDYYAAGPSEGVLASYFGWIGPLLRMSDQEIWLQCGIDAVHYLHFQKLMLKLLVVLTVWSMGVVLPINYSGGQQSSGEWFRATTISNLTGSQARVVVHTVFTVVYSVFAIIALRAHSRGVELARKRWRPPGTGCTLMLRGVPETVRDDAVLIKEHFRATYHGSHVVDVRYVPDVRELVSVDKKLDEASTMLARAQVLLRSGDESAVMPNACGCRPCCRGRKAVDEVSRLKTLVARLEGERKAAEVAARNTFCGVVFVTFSDTQVPAKCVADYRSGWPRRSPKSAALESDRWRVRVAPSPRDVRWSKLPVARATFWAWMLSVNAALFAFLLFYTTPVSLLASLEQLSKTSASLDKVKEAIESSPFFAAYVPALILLIFSLMLPAIVSGSAQLEPHATYSDLTLSVARKTYAYLLLSVLVLPCMLLTSADALFELYLPDSGDFDRRECIFLPNNGAFFVNYVVMLTFLGTILDFLRPFAFFAYRWRLRKALTLRERQQARESALRQFQFGVQYAWSMVVFATVLCFSTTCPLIVPFGALYFCIKHVIDRHSLVHACRRSHRSDGSVARAIAGMGLSAVVLYQLAIAGYVALKVGARSSQAIVLYCLLAATMSLVLLRWCDVLTLWSGQPAAAGASLRPSGAAQGDAKEHVDESTALLSSASEEGDVDDDADTVDASDVYVPPVLLPQFMRETSEENGVGSGGPAGGKKRGAAAAKRRMRLGLSESTAYAAVREAMMADREGRRGKPALGALHGDEGALSASAPDM